MSAAPRARWLGAARVVLDVCESTNDVALAQARAGAAHGTVVIADAQTAGRGRLNVLQESAPGNGNCPLCGGRLFNFGGDRCPDQNVSAVGF